MSAEGRRPIWALATLLTSATLLAVASSRGRSSSQMSQAAMAHATATATGPRVSDDPLGVRALFELFSSERADVWLCSLAGSVAVGLSGLFPLLVIPIEGGAALKTEAGCRKLKQLLSFAIGSLLGDVFLHLLPEAWAQSCSSGGSQQHYRSQGLWVILGLLSFLLLEKMFPDTESHEEQSSLSPGPSKEPWSPPSKPKTLREEEPKKIKTSGYLNLLANSIDNFTHGLAVAGSFLVSRKVGFLTTFAILLHEIPHEVGDFAILLRAGFDRWSAARMQLYTALGGVLGATVALCVQSPPGPDNGVTWILPFTSGGFLYIALVNVVPDLQQENSLRDSVLQVLLLCCGVFVMVLMSAIVD